MNSLSACRLYTFVDAGYLGSRSPDDVARALCDGGADIIQLRAKAWSAEEVAAVASRLQTIVERFGVRLVINDHLDIARKLGIPLCHLGQEDFFDAGARHVGEWVGEAGGPGIGMSTHAPWQAERSIAAGAAYIAVGPVYATATKPGREPVRLDYVRWAAENVQEVPWFAIGGINLSNLDEVLAAGARRVCVVSAILNAPDIVRACEQFKEKLG